MSNTIRLTTFNEENVVVKESYLAIDSILSVHLVDTIAGTAMQVVLKEKGKKEVPLYSNTNKIKGYKMETENIDFWITNYDDIMFNVAQLNLQSSFMIKPWDKEKAESLKEL